MNESLIVAVLSLTGTLVGAFAGILTANRLTTYRIERLEEKVDKHNKVVERTFILEGQMKEVVHEITDLKKYHQPNN